MGATAGNFVGLVAGTGAHTIFRIRLLSLQSFPHDLTFATYVLFHKQHDTTITGLLAFFFSQPTPFPVVKAIFLKRQSDHVMQ